MAGAAHSLPLFGSEDEPDARSRSTAVPERMGRARIEQIVASSILTRASGFMDAYDFTLNPYSGCAFGCTYCYAAFFAREAELRDTWGDWVKVKSNAVDKLRRMRTDIRGKTIYMSSVTDPYQPIERRLELVRELLHVLVERQPRLVVQTRSPLVTRDVDVLGRFDVKRINMTVTTDSEAVRKAFEPSCPGLKQRLDAITAVREAGIPTSITMTPLLPLEDAEAFADALVATGVRHFVVQPFHAERGKFVAGTRDEARRITAELGWDDAAYRRAVAIIRDRIPDLQEGREGFAPE